MVNFGDPTTSLTGEFMQKFRVADLPAQQRNGALAFAIDGRKSEEAAGSGSGVPVWYDADASLWRTFFDNSDVADAPDMKFVKGHVECFISSSAATVISDTVAFFQVTGTFTNSVVGAGFTVDGGGQVTYTAARTRMLHCYSSWGFSSGSVNQDLQVGVRKNSAIITASIIARRLAVSNDIGSSALHAMFTVETGDTFDVAVRNTSGSNNVTFDHHNLGVLALPNDMTGIEVP